MVKGAGTVFATAGTGGVAPRHVNLADSEAPYMAATAGLNANATYGSLDVTATATSLTANFARASGGTFADGFTMRPADATGNLAPTAAFTARCVDLRCEVNGTSSADSDGTIQSYAWDFGDGGVATGATAAHDYDAGGTYSVRLVVTDDEGVTGTTTRTVTPSPSPSPSPTVATDDFQRTVVTGWGTATSGGSWTISSATSRYSVSAGAGRISVAAGSKLNAYLTEVSSRSTVLTATISTDKRASGSGLYIFVSPRRVVGAGAYIAKVRLAADGRIYLELMRNNSSGSTEVILQSSVALAGLTYAPDDRILVKVEASGVDPTVVRAKVWKSGSAEPSAWQRSANDSTANLQSAGGVGFNAYLSSSADNGPIQFAVDELDARAP